MDSPDRIADRFQDAALRVCTRWECFDFGIPHDNQYLLDQAREHREESPDDQMQSLRSRIETEGALKTVQSLLGSGSESGGFVELWARNRLDLTMEALSIRPAWLSLFSREEHGVAANRLTEALASLPGGALAPPSTSDLDCTIVWLDETLRNVDSRPPEFVSDRPEAGGDLCKSAEEIARELDETGLFQMPFWQRRHYRSCQNCAGSYRKLDPLARELDERAFDLWRKNLKVLTTCLALREVRANQREQLRRFFEGPHPEFPHFPPADFVSDPTDYPKAWRAIVCAQGARVPSVAIWRWGLSESADQPFKSFAAGLTEPEVFALHFCSEVTRVFFDMQIDLFSVPGQSLVWITHLVLPSDGDLSSVPGVVDAIPSSDFEEWWKLMTGFDEPPFLDPLGLFGIFCETASIKQRSELIPSPSGQGLERIAATMHTQTDEITRLRDAVDSNSAAQMPIIDTLQQLVRKMDGPSRYRAEESLKKEIGEHIYTSLCRPAFDAAIAAEYVWLDSNFPDPSMIVAHLATAFERQLRDAVFKRFCDALVASGARNYPELDGNVARPPVQPASGARLFPGQPLPQIPASRREEGMPVLLRQGRMDTRLNLGKMRVLLEQPLAAMLRIFGEWGLDVLQLARLCKQIADNRNKAVHQGDFTREEASDLRDKWLGQYAGSSVFAALIPKAHQNRS